MKVFDLDGYEKLIEQEEDDKVFNTWHDSFT